MRLKVEKLTLISTHRSKKTFSQLFMFLVFYFFTLHFFKFWTTYCMCNHVATWKGQVTLLLLLLLLLLLERAKWHKLLSQNSSQSAEAWGHGSLWVLQNLQLAKNVQLVVIIVEVEDDTKTCIDMLTGASHHPDGDGNFVKS